MRIFGSSWYEETWMSASRVRSLCRPHSAGTMCFIHHSACGTKLLPPVEMPFSEHLLGERVSEHPEPCRNLEESNCHHVYVGVLESDVATIAVIHWSDNQLSAFTNQMLVMSQNGTGITGDKWPFLTKWHPFLPCSPAIELLAVYIMKLETYILNMDTVVYSVYLLKSQTILEQPRGIDAWMEYYPVTDRSKLSNLEDTKET